MFSDYARPAIRLAALMGERVIHVMTHDSIGLGEDGPTHQPVEHLAALRAIPNILVFRPCDVVETVGVLATRAGGRATGPSVLALTRQNLPQLRLGHDERNRCAAGAYEIVPAERRRPGVAVRLRIGSRDRRRGPQVPARTRRDRRASSRCRASSCSWRCRRPSAGRSSARRGSGSAIEAAVRQGWDAIIGSDGAFVGMTGFGASGPYKELYQHFGITPEAVAEAALARLGKN